jgi:hypothetical protein
LFEKFNALKSTFRDNHRKAVFRKSGSGADEVFVPSWWHYKRMLFLTDTYTPRKSSGTPIAKIPIAKSPILENEVEGEVS